MPISEERFNFADHVVETGVVAVTSCLYMDKEACETVDILLDGFQGYSLNQEGLLELLAVALMKIVKEREQHKAREDTLRG